MRRAKKFLLMLLCAMLALPVFSGASHTAQAAAASFFIPDNAVLADTANRPLANASALTRDNVLISNDGYLNVMGTFQQVSGTSLHVKVDQIAFDGTSWKDQPGKTANSSVPSPAANRFQISNMKLFPGYNRVTITGELGGVSRSDAFYVLYESGPVLVSMQLLVGNTLVDVNQTSRIVTRQGAVVFQGKILNANSVLVNGNRGSVAENGSYFSPGVILKPGLNIVEFVFSNASDELKFTREVYYYDQQQPFTSLKVTQNAQTQDILKDNVVFTGFSLSTDLEVELLVPYQSIPFEDNATVEINSGAPIPITAAHSVVEETVYGTTNQPEFKRVKFKLSGHNLTPDTAIPAQPAPNQSLALKVVYGTGTSASTAAITRTFKVAPGQVLLHNAYMLPGYAPGVTTLDDNIQKQPLNGSQSDKNSFYILVESSTALNDGDFKIDFEPLGTVVPLVPAKGATYTSNGTEKTVFLVSGFPEGTQNVVLKYLNGDSVIRAKVTYVAKMYIQVDNLNDGQVIELDSSIGATSVALKGQFIGFGSNLLEHKMFINNVDQTSELDLALSGDVHRFPSAYPGGAINLDVGAPPKPLHYGENIILFKLKYGTSAGGATREFTKQIKIYIVDKNTPNIKLVRPITPPKIGSVRGPLSSSDSTAYLLPSPEYQPSGSLANTYTTTLKDFDYFLEGNGAEEVTIKKAGEVLFKFIPSGGAAPDSTTVTPGVNVDSVIGVTVNNLPAGTSLDYYGNRSSFRIRINNLPTEELGPHVYTAELTNTTGAPVTARLEINRTTAKYRILAPRANVGNTIVVNKNFVNFDVEAEGAIQVIVNGVVATKRTDIEDRFTATVMDLKPNKENKLKLVIKRASGDLSETVNVYYSADVGVDTMYMEAMSSKHAVFNKKLNLTFPKNTVLRRSSDNKIYPSTNILFGIASPEDGVVGRVNDYGDVLGLDVDQGNQLRDPGNNPYVTPIYAGLYQNFVSPLGKEHFTTVSPYYWISVGYAERGNPGDGNYQPATGGLPPYNFVNTFGTTYPDFTFSPETRKLNPSQRGTLEIAFDPNIVVDTGSYLTVFRFNDKGEWKNIGGVVDMGKKTISVPFDEFGYYMVAKLKYSFRDIVGHSWARNVLSALYSKGMMSNLYFEDFGADDYTSRGEFAALLVKAMDLPMNADPNNSFLDVVPGSRTETWTYEEIETAARAGIVHGMSDRVFNPGGRITREEAATMIARSLNLKMAEINDKLITKLDKAFLDGPNITRYAKPAVDAVNGAKIMMGSNPDPNNKKEFVFNPQANLTRAEAGQIMVNILKKYNKKFSKELS